MQATIIQPVILCGGAGTRLWPLSRAGFPKQFLCLLGNESLFQMACKRLATLGNEQPMIVGSDAHRFLMLDQLRETGITAKSLLLEPEGKNTAPALTLAALAATEHGSDPVLVVTPADQTIANASAFYTAMQSAIREADGGAIVVLGITPTHAETGYGYIQIGAPNRESATVEAFVEKPDADTAMGYVSSGNYFWNSGMFVLKASVWLAALEAFCPDILLATKAAWEERTTDADFVRPDPALFFTIRKESVDYAVMERCPQSAFPIYMVPLDAGWNDLGSWDAVWQSAGKDSDGNASVGDTLVVDSHHTLIHANHKLVCAVGLDNIAVIETADAVLVVDRNKSQDVKKIVEMLGSRAREECSIHRKVHRPWGWYDCIDGGKHFKVKRIMVKPGASLSLQKHQHRAEHWVVVSGVADVVCGAITLQLHKNQSTYIPQGEVHRLSNSGSEPLEIIEVQSGDYLGEDDIIRLQDHYGRKT